MNLRLTQQSINSEKLCELFLALMDPFLRTKIDDNIDVFLIILTFNMVFTFWGGFEAGWARKNEE